MMVNYELILLREPSSALYRSSSLSYSNNYRLLVSSNICHTMYSTFYTTGSEILISGRMKPAATRHFSVAMCSLRMEELPYLKCVYCTGDGV